MQLRNGKKFNDGRYPYIVAELNSGHNGNSDTAKKMIKAAKECGCDAVKFQSWSAESLYCKDYYDANPIAKRMVSRFALKAETLLELSEYCREIDIDFSSTPYSKEEVDFLADECHAPFIKIASMDINYLPYLRYIAEKRVPIVLSTGMATLQEIQNAVKTIEETGMRDVCILHCVSLYPTENENVNLNNMLMLKKQFPQYAVGYSDHTSGIAAAGAATAMGAAMIEKHFTLDKKKVGWDNQMATEPAEMAELVRHCKTVYSILGKYDREVSDAELAQRKKMRRSLTAAKNLPAGTVLRESDLAAKRPGDGIPADRYKDVIGCELKCDVEEDRLILPEFLTGKERDKT